jgi:uncharacterized protein YkwD
MRLKNTIKIFLLLFMLSLTASGSRVFSDPLKGKMTALEKEVLAEINLVRIDPKGYAEQYIKPMLSKFKGNIYDNRIMTNEGTLAVEECIRELAKVKPLPPLAANDELVSAAKYHTERQGKAGSVGHNTPGGKTFQERLRDFGYAGEVISYGKDTAREIVIQLLVDDGVADRGHRKNVLNKEFTHAGVAFGAHEKYRHMCTIDFCRVTQNKR